MISFLMTNRCRTMIQWGKAVRCRAKMQAISDSPLSLQFRDIRKTQVTLYG